MDQIEAPKAKNVSKESAELAKTMEETLISHSEATFRDTVKALNALGSNVKETKRNVFEIAKQCEERKEANKEKLAKLQKEVKLLMSAVANMEKKIATLPKVMDTVQLLVKSVTGVKCTPENVSD